MVLTANGGPARLFRNDGGNRNHWLRLKLVGTKSNRDAIGAKRHVQAGETPSGRSSSPAKGYLPPSSCRSHSAWGPTGTPTVSKFGGRPGK